METKQCTKCKINKLLNEYSYSDKSAGRFRTICKNCQAIIRKQNYNKNRKKEIKNSIITNKNRKNKNRIFLYNYLLENPCPCGENNPILLEFNHKDIKEKTYTISQMVNRHLSKIKMEIEKCEILCVKCHRLKTAEQFNWYKDLILSGLIQEYTGKESNLQSQYPLPLLVPKTSGTTDV